MERKSAYITVILILFSIYNISVLVISDWIAKQLGMTGMVHFCGVIVLWMVLFVGILKVAMDIRVKNGWL